MVQPHSQLLRQNLLRQNSVDTIRDVIAPFPVMPPSPPREPQSPEKTELPRRWPPPETPEAPADVPMPGVTDPGRPQPGM